MRLELDVLNIKDVRFAEKTTISDGILHIDRHELQELLQQDKRFSKVDIELVHAGESCRVVRVFDVTEPRAKIDGTGQNFPGVLGKLETAGQGCTRVLRGAAVVTIDSMAEQRIQLFDASGPGADLAPYGKLQNVILLCPPVNGIAYSDYRRALRIASLKAAVYLAEATEDLKAEEVEVYELGPLAEAVKGMEPLPRVAYIYQIHALQQSVEKPPDESIFYGDNVSQLLPTIVHPNEILDGAILKGYTALGQETYSIQNHPVVQELYNRHGKELCFVGVVITVAQSTEPERERSVATAAKLVKSVLGADAVILTKIGGGAPHIDLAQTCELCEEQGVKTVCIVAVLSADSTSESALIFNSPRADAIVNVGAFTGSNAVTLPSVERVLGGPATFGGKPAEAEIEVPSNLLTGSISQVGASRLVMREI